MSTSHPLTMLCIATYEKGQEFLRECKRQGCRVLLITVESLRDADWPREAIDEIFYLARDASDEDVLKGVSWLARKERLDRIVPLDDFDVETAALLREHLRVPGMGDSTTRYFRDKLAMRVKARDHGIPVPAFVHVLHHETVRQYLAEVRGPWVLKPRSQASAVGILKIDEPAQLWHALDELGDDQSDHLLEQYIPGDVFHVDAIVWDREVVFAVSHQYGPAADGRRARRRHLHDASAAEGRARTVDPRGREPHLLSTLGFVRGVTHTEFIRGRDDRRFYFLETAARVGGAHIVETVEAATGVNLWAEWAKVEIAGESGEYAVRPSWDRAAGIVLSLARDEQPDTSAFTDPEIYFQVQKSHHIGFVVASDDPAGWKRCWPTTAGGSRRRTSRSCRRPRTSPRANAARGSWLRAPGGSGVGESEGTASTRLVAEGVVLKSKTHFFRGEAYALGVRTTKRQRRRSARDERRAGRRRHRPGGPAARRGHLVADRREPALTARAGEPDFTAGERADARRGAAGQ